MNSIASRLLFDAEVSRLSPQLLASRGWDIVSRTYPLLEVVFRQEGKAPLLLRMSFEKWNGLPPSATMLKPDREPLPQPLSGAIFNHRMHPLTGRPFICMPGIREYHVHWQHLTDRWENYRAQGDYDLGGILTRVWNGWRTTS